MIEDEDQEALAAEYVLGTLDADERAQADALRIADPNFARMVDAWERRLGELNTMVVPVEPPQHVWNWISGQIAGEPPTGDIRLPDPTPPSSAETAASRADNVVDFASARRWRATSILTGAIAASLALFIGAQQYRPDMLPEKLRPPVQVVEVKVPAPAPDRGEKFVAVLQKDAASPAFLLTVDVATRTMTARRVGAEQLSGQSYELWLVSDRFDKPRSLGVIGTGEFDRTPALASYEPDVINQATYAVTLEPQGGSPTGQATGPILWTGKLIEAEPPATKP
jgi:anti-sigma-K factor RskA